MFQVVVQSAMRLLKSKKIRLPAPPTNASETDKKYEPKDKTLIYDFDDIDFKEAKLDFRLEVKDNVGNVEVYETSLFRKPL